MLSNWDEIEKLKEEDNYSNIVTKTLGYSLTDDENIKNQLCELFNIIENNIRLKVTDPEKRAIYGRTLCGIKDAVSIENWYNENLHLLLSAVNEENILEIAWYILKEIFINKTNIKVNNFDNLKTVLFAWISGKPYKEILEIFHQNNLEIKRGHNSREAKIGDVIDICDNKISFDGCMVLSAIYEFTAQDVETNQNMMLLLQKLQKRLRYGLPDETSILIYELGFCDRTIAQDIKNELNIFCTDRLETIFSIKTNRDRAVNCISKYPAYYQMKMDNLVR